MKRGSEEMEHWRETRYEHEGSGHVPTEPPAWTRVNSAARADPAMMIEIEAIALVREPDREFSNR
jgi:enamine deaminase RidA (YjgF/YER057c/UK114 family)